MTPAATEDRLLNGQVAVCQPRTGFRAGMDSVLLAASLPTNKTTRALDWGCGSGAALFCAAWRLPDVQFTGADIDEPMLALAERGRVANGFEKRIDLRAADAGAPPDDFESAFDLVFSNPPFFEPGETTAPGEGKDAAFISEIGLEAWIKAMLSAAKPKAPIVLIHRAAALARILASLEKRAGEIVVLPIRPEPGAEAKRVVVRARKGLRAGPCRLLDGLALYETGGRTASQRAAAALAGGALDWA
ncbi:MAG: methyltransferase [Pseudomonadota bacterium]